MKITVDLRNLQTGFLSGIENYTLNILERLLKLDSTNQYTLFYNTLKQNPVEHLHFINSRVVRRKVPNKLLNLSLRTLNYPKFEKFIGEFDLLFLPNFNQFAIEDKTKLALTVHDLSPFIAPEFYNLKRRLWHASLNAKKTLQRADMVFAVSEYTKMDLVQKFGIQEEKITVTHLGVNSEAFRPDLDEGRLREVRNIYNLPGEFILYLGTIEPRKNVEGLVKAFSRMNTTASLVLAGRPGWKFGSIFREIKNSNKSRKIQVLGFVEEADKPYIVKLAKVFAFPSFYEGFGLPVLEAMSVGTPVLTSQLTSLPEVAGKSALLVNPYNTDDIALGLEQLLTNNGLRQLLRDEGLKRAKEFTWEKTAEKVYDKFKK